MLQREVRVACVSIARHRQVQRTSPLPARTRTLSWIIEMLQVHQQGNVQLVLLEMSCGEFHLRKERASLFPAQLFPQARMELPDLDIISLRPTASGIDL